MIKATLLGLALVATAAPAIADPCEAQLPSKAGTVFTGSVRYIVDGDGFCIGASSDPNTWVEVRLVDFNAPELSTPEGKRGKDIIEREIIGKEASCTTKPGRSGRTTSYDRVLASCRVGGSNVADLLKRANAPEGGN